MAASKNHLKPYKIPKIFKHHLPIPALSWVPFWLLGIVLSNQYFIPFFILLPTVLICFICFSASKTRVFSIPTIALIAGYLISLNSQTLPENHISNILKSHDIPQGVGSKGWSAGEIYISNDETWRATSFKNQSSNREYIQQYIRGRIIGEKQPITSGYIYRLELISSFDILLKGNVAFFTDNDSLNHGDIIETTLIIRENKPSNPGERDFFSYQKQSNIYASAYHISPIYKIESEDGLHTKTTLYRSLEKAVYSFVLKIKNIIRYKFQSHVNYSAPMAISLILGERHFLNYYGNDFYSDTLPLSGLMHFFAVSGFHVGLVAFYIMLFFTIFRIPKNIIHILTILILVIYALLCDLSPPVVRAVIFCSLFIIAGMTSRIVSKWQIYFISLFIVTLVNPSLLFSVSLQLSYLAFAGIILATQLYTKAYKYFSLSKYTTKVGKVFTYVIKYILMICCIQFLIMPAQIYYFEYFNMNAFIGNILGTLFIGALLPLFIIILILPAWTPFYNIFVICAEFLTEAFNHYIVFLSKLPFAFQHTQNISEIIALNVLLAFGLLLIAYCKNKKRLFQGLAMCLLSLTLFIPVKEKRSFQVIFFDTGNSDSFLVRFSENDYMVIDTGDVERNRKNITRNLLRYLKHQKVSSISKVLITHEHLDHYGGIFKLGEQVKIDTLMISRYFYNSPTMEHIRLSQHFQNTVFFVIDDTLTYKQDDYTIHFLHPDQSYWHGNVNNLSLVCKIDYQGVSILFTGDLEWDGEQHLINNYPTLLKADILKGGHHGSNTSSQQEFLNYVKPELIVFSADEFAGSGFPSSLVLDRASRVTNKIFITGSSGAVKIDVAK